MNQRFIKLGQGYADFFELMELASTQQSRIHAFIKLQTDDELISLAIALTPAGESRFMPIYICLEGTPVQSKRIALFDQLAQSMNYEIPPLRVKSSAQFHNEEHYYHYLLGLLRLQRILPPMS